MFGCLLPSLHSVRFGQLLRCVHKRIVNLIKSAHRKEEHASSSNAIPYKILTINLGNLEVGNLRVYEIGLIAVTGCHHSVQLWNSTVNRYRWIPRTGSLKLC